MSSAISWMGGYVGQNQAPAINTAVYMLPGVGYVQMSVQTNTHIIPGYGYVKERVA